MKNIWQAIPDRVQYLHMMHIIPDMTYSEYHPRKSITETKLSYNETKRRYI